MAHTDSNPSPTDAGAIISEIEKLQPARVVEIGDQKVLITRQGQTINSVKKLLDEYLAAPERKKGTATLTTLQSLIDFANRGKDGNSVIYADRETPDLTVILDYNPAGAPSEAARFGEHRGVYEFPFSDEWVVWRDNNKRAMNQKDFAEFIENRLADLADPSNPQESAKEFAARCGLAYAQPSTILQCSKGLELHAVTQVKQAVKLETGETQFSFMESHEHKGGGLLTVPGAFLIQIPVFRDGLGYQLPVRLRYRLLDGSVKWFYELYRSDFYFDHAFKTACKEAAEKTSLPLLFGTPEE